MRLLFSSTPKYLFAALVSLGVGLTLLLIFGSSIKPEALPSLGQTEASTQLPSSENALPADLLQEWVALGDYLSARPEFSYAEQVYLHRLSAQPVKNDTRLCVFLAITDSDEPYRVLSPSCVLIGSEQQFSFSAEQALTRGGTPEVTLFPSADRDTLKQINDMFSLYDHGLVQLSLHII